MTENEIIECLKENKKKGIGYKFLPEEVQKWIYENFYKKILVYFDYQGEWVSIDDTDLTKSCNYQNHIFSLSDNYELKKIEKTGEWIDFEIDENGCYRILDTDMRFHWSEWNKPLWIYEKDENRSWYLTDFGGWKYENDDRWYMVPAIKNINDNQYWNSYTNDKEFIKPCIPIKIRFFKSK